MRPTFQFARVEPDPEPTAASVLETAPTAEPASACAWTPMLVELIADPEDFDDDFSGPLAAW